MQCEMCGKNTNLFRTVIEGAQLSVCKECGGHGKVLGVVKTKEEIKLEEKRVKDFLEGKKSFKEEVPEERIVDAYSMILKRKRESMGLTQEEFAKRLNEKESIIHHMEQGKFIPSIVLARKLERILGVKLVEEVKTGLKIEKTSSSGITIGDLLSGVRKS